jgi:hypothetical protein
MSRRALKLWPQMPTKSGMRHCTLHTPGRSGRGVRDWNRR